VRLLPGTEVTSSVRSWQAFGTSANAKTCRTHVSARLGRRTECAQTRRLPGELGRRLDSALQKTALIRLSDQRPGGKASLAP